jgi:hypothetical protein
MLENGMVVMATLGDNEDGQPRTHFGALCEGEFYRVTGKVMGHKSAGENYAEFVKSVRLAGVAEYWPAEFFVPVPTEVLEKLREKVSELDALGESQVVTKSVRRVLEAS